MKDYSSSDDELLYMIYQKDEYSLQELMAKYQTIIAATAYRFFHMLLSPNEMQDVIQEGMLCLYQAIDSFRMDKAASFQTYFNHFLYYHFCNRYDYYQHKNGQLHRKSWSLNRMVNEKHAFIDYMVNEDHDLEGERYLQKREAYEQLQKRMKYFKPFEKEVIRLRLLGYSYKEIASNLKLKEKQVEYILSKLRKSKTFIDYKDAL